MSNVIGATVTETAKIILQNKLQDSLDEGITTINDINQMGAVKNNDYHLNNYLLSILPFLMIFTHLFFCGKQLYFTTSQTILPHLQINQS